MLDRRNGYKPLSYKRTSGGIIMILDDSALSRRIQSSLVSQNRTESYPEGCDWIDRTHCGITSWYAPSDASALTWDDVLTLRVRATRNGEFHVCCTT